MSTILHSRFANDDARKNGVPASDLKNIFDRCIELNKPESSANLHSTNHNEELEGVLNDAITCGIITRNGLREAGIIESEKALSVPSRSVVETHNNDIIPEYIASRARSLFNAAHMLNHDKIETSNFVSEGGVTPDMVIETSENDAYLPKFD